jgi:hypothetical protein
MGWLRERGKMKRLFAIFLLIVISSTWAKKVDDNLNHKGPVAALPRHEPKSDSSKPNGSDSGKGKANQEKLPPLLINEESTSRFTSNKENHAESRADSDLVQQKRMADASENSVYATIAGVFFSLLALGVSVWIARYTFRQSQIFHIELKTQAQSIQRQTIAEMRASEKKASERDRKDLRAYLSVKVLVKKADLLNGPIIDNSGDNPPKAQAYRVIVENVGRSPAHKFSVTVRTCVDKRIKPNEENMTVTNDAAEYLKFAFSLSPNGNTETPVYITKTITPEQKVGFISRELGMFVYGAVFFEDAFGYRHHVNFRFVHRIPDEGNRFNDEIDTHHHGNDAT